MILKHENEIDHHRHDEIRRQHMDRIGLPGHRFAADPLPDQNVNEIVDRIAHRIQEGFPVGHDPGEVTTHRNADQGADQQRQGDL